MSNNIYDIVVVGAGIIGCSIACRLAKAGMSVTVIDRARPCQEASWAAAGMLAPHAEMAHSVPEALRELMLASRKLYPDFVANLSEETGIEIGYQKRGSLMVSRSYRESRLLTGLYERAVSRGVRAEALSETEARRRQPRLSDRVESAVFFPDDQHIDNRTLCKALVAAATGFGVDFKEGQPVIGLEVETSRVIGVRTAAGMEMAGTVIVAGGSWSGAILASAGLNVPVRPVRGQIVELSVQPQFLRQLLHTGSCYLTPWPDGRTILGATMEKVGFDKSVTAGGVQGLLAAATALVPGLRDAAISNAWAGLRPDTSDNLPVLGRTPLKGLVLATGHFRNGILLTPVTAQLIFELLTEKPLSHALAPFSVERFLADSDEST